MMRIYNYERNICEDIRDYIRDNFTEEEIAENLIKNDDWASELHDLMWCEDSITGNASGSYTFNRYAAEEFICHNLDLLNEALVEFGWTGCDILGKGAEWCDVLIRCYLLGPQIERVLDEMYDEIIGKEERER